MTEDNRKLTPPLDIVGLSSVEFERMKALKLIPPDSSLIDTLFNYIKTNNPDGFNEWIEAEQNREAYDIMESRDPEFFHPLQIIANKMIDFIHENTDYLENYNAGTLWFALRNKTHSLISSNEI